jgi:hypothetical protein
MFCKGVQQSQRFCLHHLVCAKMAAFPLYLQSEQQRRVAGANPSKYAGWREGTHVVFAHKFPGKKQHAVMMQQPVPLLSKFRAKSL